MTFAFWLCNGCVETHGAIANTMMVPDEIFFQKMRAAQLEEFRRELTEREILQQLDNEGSSMSKLARDRKMGGT